MFKEKNNEKASWYFNFISNQNSTWLDLLDKQLEYLIGIWQGNKKYIYKIKKTPQLLSLEEYQLSTDESDKHAMLVRLH